MLGYREIEIEVTRVILGRIQGGCDGRCRCLLPQDMCPLSEVVIGFKIRILGGLLPTNARDCSHFGEICSGLLGTGKV